MLLIGIPMHIDGTVSEISFHKGDTWTVRTGQT